MLGTYRNKFKVYKAAQRLYFRCDPRRRLSFLFWHRIMPVISTAALGVLLWDIVLRRCAFSPSVAGVLGGVSFLGLSTFALRPLQLRRDFRKIMQNGGLDQNLELELKDGELVTRVPGRSESRFQPAAIYDMVRDQEVCLLFLRKRLFLYVPRQNLPEEQWAALTAWSGKGRTV